MTKQIPRILWLHPVTAVGGSSISLTELLKPLLGGEVTGLVVTPEGSAADRFRKSGLDVLPVRGLSQWDNTLFGRYRGARWLILLREIFYLPASVRVLFFLLRQRHKYDLIHLNEITLLPLGVLAKRLLALPLIVHVRSLQPTGAMSRRNRWFNRMLRLHADAVIAIDETVRRTLPADIPAKVIHNVLGSAPCDRSAPIDSPGRERRFRVAMVGGLLVMKGVYEFVEAAKICKQRGLDLEFVLAGENARKLKGLSGKIVAALGFGRDVKADLDKMIRGYGISDMVILRGFVDDIGKFYKEIDVLCFPSHLNAAGRPVFEASLFGVPSIVAMDDPPADTMIPDITGICIKAKDPVALADAIEKLYRDSGLCRKMGVAAKKLAERVYDAHGNAMQLLALYQEALMPSQHR